MLSKKSRVSKSRSKTPAKVDSKKARVLIVDDHPVMREGMKRVLGKEPDLEVCGEAANIRQAMEEIESSKPDLVVVDISLAGENGIDLIKEIKVRYPQMFILAYSMHDESIYAERALRTGANGYITKHEPTQSLVDAVRHVLQGEIHLNPAIVKHIMHRLAAGHPDKGSSPIRSLTEREFEVLKLMGRGLATQQIADTLHISAKTVHVHRAKIGKKLDLKGSAALVHFAIQWVESQA